MSLSPEEIQQVLAVLTESVWDEAVVTVGEVTIAVARNGASLPATGAPPGTAQVSVNGTIAPQAASAPPPAPAPAPVSPPAPSAAPASAATLPAAALQGTQVTAPSIGVFWRAPEPGAPPFVDIGQRVEEGQEMCIIEVMKLMNRVRATVTGTVSAVHVENGEAVEFATPLFTILPE